MLISIDCRMINASGVGVYLRECLPYFLSSEHNFVLLGDTEKLSVMSQAYKNTEIISCPVKPFSLRELFGMPRTIVQKINHTDRYYSPYFNIPAGIRIPIYTTIHDILFPDMPELTSRLGLAARMWFYRRAARCSKRIFTVSAFSKSRIEHFLGTCTPVIQAGNAAQSLFQSRSSSSLEKKNHIIFIGNIKRHKGLSCLLEAFFNALAAGLEYTLVIVGSKDKFRSADTQTARLLEGIKSERVVFTGFIPDEELKVRVSQAALLVQPSLYEGFGYPPLEAMLSGTKALISDIPVFKEVYDDFPVTFFHAGDSADLMQKLMKELHNKAPQRLVLSNDLRARYTFAKTAAAILLELTGT
ncbi:glycosyltransferase family 4 protein [Breznakiellaceae bacterium SP9]